MKYFLPIILFFTVIIYSCQKNENINPKNSKLNSTALKKLGVTTNFIENTDGDSIERATVLGSRLNNPYTIANMRTAYANLRITNVTVDITNLYVRFKPTTADQLDLLENTMEAQNLELFDTPVDYDVSYEGDYYQDPAIAQEQISWQYAVVLPTFTFPAGIQYETIAQLHIPNDNYTAVETEAERIANPYNNTTVNSTTTSNSTTTTTTTSNSKKLPITPNILECTKGYHFDYETKRCVPDNCPSGYVWNGVECVSSSPTPTYPAPAADAAKPAGRLNVWDTQLLSPTNTVGTAVPVRKVRVVARRWFKIERVFTDNEGNFQFSKRFKDKVRINVKFKNSDAAIRGMKGARLWQILFPIKKTLGLYTNNKSNVLHTFNIFGSLGSKGNRFWVAATAHNAVQEYRDFAAIEGIGLPSTGIKIIVTNWVDSGGGAAPMWSKRQLSDFPAAFIKIYLVSFPSIIVAGLFMLEEVLRKQIDIAISYKDTMSDKVKENVYHELSHCAHYQKLGNSWYGPFVQAEISSMQTSLGTDNSPYGKKTDADAGIIALGEGWAYYMGRHLTDRRYGSVCSRIDNEQGSYFNNNPLPMSSQLNALEGFNPLRTTDPFYWIPQGLFYDLRDPRNDLGFPLIDEVSNYTNQQMFSALSSSTTSLPTYKTNLLTLNNNNQSTQVTSLFFRYGY